MEGKTLSNKVFASSRSDKCSALRESVSERGELSFQDCGVKNPHSQVVQEAEFAVVGIGIALLRSHAQKAAFALNRSGDYAVAGREIAFYLRTCRMHYAYLRILCLCVSSDE